MNILIIDLQKKPAVTKNGNPYEQLLVVYKILPDGKVAQKTLLPFGEGMPVFKVLDAAKKDDCFEVEVVKNGQFNEWVSIHRQDSPPKAPEKVPTMIAKPTYETPDERAERQKLIVRQSCLSNAISTLEVGAKTLDVSKVLELSEQYFNWVFQKEAHVRAPQSSNGFEDMQDTI